MAVGLRGGAAWAGSGLAGMMEDTFYTCLGLSQGAGGCGMRAHACWGLLEKDAACASRRESAGWLSS
jgi:hypothetical protein